MTSKIDTTTQTPMRIVRFAAYGMQQQLDPQRAQIVHRAGQIESFPRNYAPVTVERAVAVLRAAATMDREHLESFLATSGIDSADDLGM